MRQDTRGRVLVTGATGYAAGHCIVDLLAQGYDVRGTVRSLSTADIEHLRPAIDQAASSEGAVDGGGGSFELAEATLDADKGWAEAVEGCDYILHVASPIPFKAPKKDDEIIRPAVDGTTRVMTAAAKAGVKRVVYTSSLDTVTQDSSTEHRVRTEEDWSDLAQCSAYGKSKVLAEKAAWDIADKHGMELATVLPGAIIGPLLQVKRQSTGDMVRMMLSGKMPVIPPLSLGFSDVRDLATAHRLAMEVPAAAGNRYICAEGPLWMKDIAQILKDEFGPHGYSVSTRPLPAWVLRATALVSDEAKLAVTQLSAKHNITAAKAGRDLGWAQRPLRQTLTETASMLIEHGHVRPKRRAADNSK
jgi:nucleoside-diphosphate-sugar epimerase